MKLSARKTVLFTLIVALNPFVAPTLSATTVNEGALCNIEHTPTSIRKWGINFYNLNSGEKKSVFGIGNNRKIQSVACNSSGSVILFTMQETPRGEYDVYALLNGNTIPIRLTDNDYDDLHVTMDKQGQLAAWQGELPDGRQSIMINQLNPDGTYSTTKTLASAYPYLQPSLSQNGNWLTFIQLRKSAYLIFRYNLSTETFTQVNRTPRRKRAHHPSISDDGNYIGFSEGRNQNKYWIKDLSTQTKYPLVNNSDAIEHATISGDAQSFVYSLNLVSGERQSYLFDRETLESSSLDTSLLDPDRFLGSYFSQSVYQPLSDTGVTNCVNPDDWWNIPVDCSAYSSQDQGFGRDVERNISFDGIAGFSYTKIDGDGNALPAAADEWSCVRDNVNGLVWQVKESKNQVVGDQGLHDSDDRFTWFNSDPATNGGNQGDSNDGNNTCYQYASGKPCNTETYVSSINQEGYCGMNNWRLPSRSELVSIINYGGRNAAADRNYFRDLNEFEDDLHVWSRDSKASHPEGAWNVDFFDGNYFIYDKTEAHSIRLVSDGKELL